MHTLRRYNVIHMEINIHDMKYGCGFLQRIGDMNVVSLQLVETNDVLVQLIVILLRNKERK